MIDLKLYSCCFSTQRWLPVGPRYDDCVISCWGKRGRDACCFKRKQAKVAGVAHRTVLHRIVGERGDPHSLRASLSTVAREGGRQSPSTGIEGTPMGPVFRWLPPFSPGRMGFLWSPFFAK